MFPLLWTQFGHKSSLGILDIISHRLPTLTTSLPQPCLYLRLNKADCLAEFNVRNKFHVRPLVNGALVHLQKFAELLGRKKPIHSWLVQCG